MGDELQPQPEVPRAPRDLVAESIEKAAAETGVKDPLLIELAKEVMRRRQADRIKGDLGNLALEVAAQQKNMTLGSDQKAALDQLVLKAETETEQNEEEEEQPEAPVGKTETLPAANIKKPDDKAPETTSPAQTAQADQETPSGSWDEEPDGFLAKLDAFARNIDKDSFWARFQKPLLGLVSAFTFVFAYLAKHKWIERYVPVRDGLIPSEMLAKPPFNDLRAKATVEGKNRLRKETGLHSDVINKLKRFTGEEFVKKVKEKPDDFTNDHTQQARLVFFSNLLQQTPGVTKDMPILEAAGAGQQSTTEAPASTYLMKNLKYREPIVPTPPPVQQALPPATLNAQGTPAPPQAPSAAPQQIAAVIPPPGANPDKDPTAKR